MNTQKDIAAQCAFSAAALATLGADPIWDASLSNYLRLWALTNAECDFGALAKASQASELEEYRLEELHGPQWRSNPVARAAFNPTSEATIAAENAWTKDICEPYWQAARDLAMTPAPTLAAALFKAQLIRWDELDNDGGMTREPMEIVAEDMARLADASTARVHWDGLVAELAAIEAAEPSDDTIDRAGELIAAVMEMPAPDAAAAAWKLDYLLDEAGSTGSYASEFVAQTITDYRHFLGGA